MDQLLNINDWYLFPGAASVIGFQRIVAPRLLGMPTDESAVAAAVPRAKAAIDELARLLAENSFLAGDAPSRRHGSRAPAPFPELNA